MLLDLLIFETAVIVEHLKTIGTILHDRVQHGITPGSVAATLAICAVIVTSQAFLQTSAHASDCTQTSTALVPLTDLGAGTYQGLQGGLYPGGQNSRPSTHDAALTAAVNAILPLDESGFVDSIAGKIGFTTMGMSNTEQHSTAFETLMVDPISAGVNPSVVFFTGAQSGKAASSWADSADGVWDTLADRVTAAGLTNLQVQVIWVSQAEPAESLSPFPAGAVELKDWLVSALQTLKIRYPNIRVAYFSSRNYAGYATSSLNPEPVAYESGFAVKFLIRDQINGDPELVYDGPSPMAPVVVWGPYLWADGLGPDGVPGGDPGRSDGLEWLCGDFASDGTHPSSEGADKVALMLFDWLMTDPGASVWFSADAPSAVASDVRVVPALTASPHPARGSTVLRWQADGEPGELTVFDVAGRLVLRQAVPSASTSVQIPLRSLPSGVYYARAVARGNVILGMTRIVVVR